MTYEKGIRELYLFKMKNPFQNGNLPFLCLPEIENKR